MAKSGVDVFGAPLVVGDLVIFPLTERGEYNKRLSVRDARMATGRVVKFGKTYISLEVVNPTTLEVIGTNIEHRLPKGVIKIEVIQDAEPEA